MLLPNLCAEGKAQRKDGNKEEEPDDQDQKPNQKQCATNHPRDIRKINGKGGFGKFISYGHGVFSQERTSSGRARRKPTPETDTK